MDDQDRTIDDLLEGQPPAITDDQVRGFEQAAAPLLAWMAAYGNPHISAIVTPVGAELLAGLTAFRGGRDEQRNR